MLDGAGRGFCGNRRWRATRSAFVWLPRDVPHGYTVDSDETLRTLAFTVPAGFERFVAEAGARAGARTLPPPSAPDFDKLVTAGNRHNIETLGPPEA